MIQAVWNSDGSLSLLEGQTGWKSIVFELNGKCWDGRSSEQRVDIEPVGNGLCVRRFIKGPAIIQSLSDDAEFQADGPLNYYHSSNVRRERYPLSTQETPLIRPLPMPVQCFNDGEGNQFPAFAILDSSCRNILVEGDLDQTHFRRFWELGTESRKAIERYDQCGTPMEVPEGEEREVSCVYYEIIHNAPVQKIFEGYIETLKERFSFAVRNSSMLHGGVYCTWNYGTKEHISEEIIMKRAAALAENLPECTHFLIDDGYQAGRKDVYAGVEAFYPNPAEGYNKKLFPRGMRFLSDYIRKQHLHPAIWLAPSVYVDSRLAQEHPEWLMHDREGNLVLIDSTNTTFLDYSVPEAYDFMMSILDTLFVTWGFEGIKFDYVSHNFTLEKGTFRHGSGCEWRDRIFSEIRKRIGPSGLFITCIAMSMGNPFPGLYADCYRCGRDIHDGTRPEQLRACHSTLPQILLPGKELFLLDMDSVGFGEIPFHEQHFRFVWVFITQGILELGGPVETMTKDHFAMWRKLFRPEGRGNRVECLDEQAFWQDDLPRILRSGKFTAYFNWSEEETVRFKHSSKKTPVDYLTGLPYPQGEVVLEPFCAALIEDC